MVDFMHSFDSMDKCHKFCSFMWKKAFDSTVRLSKCNSPSLLSCKFCLFLKFFLHMSKYIYIDEKAILGKRHPCQFEQQLDVIFLLYIQTCDISQNMTSNMPFIIVSQNHIPFKVVALTGKECLWINGLCNSIIVGNYTYSSSRAKCSPTCSQWLRINGLYMSDLYVI